MREAIPVGPLRVRVRLPQGTTAKNVRLLTAGTSPAPQTTKGVVTLTVPSVEVHEVVAIDL